MPTASRCRAIGTCAWRARPRACSAASVRSRPSDLYFGGSEAGIWKSTDYGNTWTMIHPGFGYVAQGLGIAIGPSTPATIYLAAACGCGNVHKSTDGGATFRTTGGGIPGDLYS